MTRPVPARWAIRPDGQVGNRRRNPPKTNDLAPVALCNSQPAGQVGGFSACIRHGGEIGCGQISLARLIDCITIADRVRWLRVGQIRGVRVADGT
jgi:hypothetical protein